MQENARLILALRDMGLTDKEIGDDKYKPKKLDIKRD